MTHVAGGGEIEVTFDGVPIEITEGVEVNYDPTICNVCGEPLIPIYENNGFNEPGAEHFEFVRFEACQHKTERNL